MAKLRVLQSTLNAGELSPLLRGRPDIARYQHGLELCRNALPLVTGGVTRSPGSLHVDLIADDSVLLLPLRLTLAGVLTGYVLAFSHQQIRFYRGDTRAAILDDGEPVTLATPYTSAQLPDLRFEIQENILYLVHPGIAPYRLTRGADDLHWTLSPVLFVHFPMRRPPETDTIELTPSVTSGTGTLTASTDFFEASHDGVVFMVNGGLARIDDVISPLVANVTMIRGIVVPNNMIRISDTVVVTANPGAMSGVQSVTLTIVAKKTSESSTLELLLTSTITPDPLPAGVTAAVQSTSDNGTGLESYTDTVTLTFDPGAMAGIEAITVKGQADQRLTQIVFLGDYINVVAYTLTTTISALPAGITTTKTTAKVPITGKEPDKFWKEQAWSNRRGWPQAVGFAEQRMVLASNATYPTAQWWSKTGQLFDFEVGTLDDEAIDITLAPATSSINHLVSGEELLSLTFDQLIGTAGGRDEGITPTNPNIRLRTRHGASPRVRPVAIAEQVYFASPSGKRLRGLAYVIEQDGYAAPDLTVLADHLFEGGGIVDMAYAREPVPAIWIVTAAGTLVSLTLDRDQQVQAWAQHETDGTETYLSVTSIPGTNGEDSVWVAVQRGEVISIEVFDSTLNTHDAVVGMSEEGQTEWTGLDHLDGQTVDIVADGYVLPQQVVIDGTVTLDFPAHAVEIGRHYVSTVKDLPPHIEGAAGGQTSINQVRVLLHKSSGCKINGEVVPFQQFGDNLLDQPVQPFTGWKDVNVCSGWSANGDTAQVEIVQDLPLPFTVLAIVKELSVNG